jgi:hypothetical protein
MSLNNSKRTNNTMDLCSKKVSELNVRLPRRDISSYINGIEISLLLNPNFFKQSKTSLLLLICFVNSSDFPSPNIE